MPSYILTHLWLGFLVAMFFVVLYGIHRLQRRHRKATGLGR
jgi:flagellar biogenesis protein FliO